MLRFHAVHGSNISLDLDSQRASRAPDSFCDGITFSQDPLEVGELYCISVIGRPDDSDWSGALRIGVTSVDPATLASSLPKYACPDLITKEGFWARPVKEELVKHRARIGFCLNTQGELQLTVNNRAAGCLLTDLPMDVSLWVIIDVYGSTQSVQFVQEDTIPAEILARGPDAVEAYVRLRKVANAPLYRGRVFIVGHDRPSNSRLKFVLSGEKASTTFASEDTIIECHHWCKIDSRGNWKMDCRDTAATQISAKKHSFAFLEDDYEAAIARNIAVEILRNRQKKATKSGKASTRLSTTKPTMVTSSKVTSSRARSFQPKSSQNKVAPVHETTFARLPPNMVNMVENYLKDLQNDNLSDKLDSTVIVDLHDDIPTDIAVSLWQLGGHPDLMPGLFHFLSREAVYLVTFDITQDLQAPASKKEWHYTARDWVEGTADNMSNLDQILAWINLIHHKTRIKPDASASDDFFDDDGKFANNILIIGTNRSNLHPDPRIQESMANLKFEVIREALRGRGMANNVCQTYYAIDEENNFCDENFSDNCECQLCQMRVKIFHSLMRLPRMGMRIPESWVGFEKVIQTWIDKGIQHASVEEMFESYACDDLQSFKSLLVLYTDLGLVYSPGEMRDKAGFMSNAVIFSTQSFANLIAQLTSPPHFAKLKSTHLETSTIELNGWLSTATLRKICENHHWDVSMIQTVLSALKFLHFDSDAVCFFPLLNICEIDGDESPFNCDLLAQDTSCLYYEFDQPLPCGAFQKSVVQIMQSVSEKSLLSYQMTSPTIFSFEIDPFHRISVEQVFSQERSCQVSLMIKVSIKRKENKPPSPHVCTAIVGEIGNALASICSAWYPRLSFEPKIACICGSSCEDHRIAACSEPQCLHLIKLDEALSSTMIWCGYKQINTLSIRKKYSVSAGELPIFDHFDKAGSSKSMSLPVAAPDLSTLFHLRPPSTKSRLTTPTSPSWLRGASKLLDSGFNQDSWRQLGELLGYKESKLDHFDSSYQPSRSLLKDWLESSGGTDLSTEMLLACLRELKRFDVIDAINESDEEVQRQSKHDIFISYQWESQKEVMLIRAKLEKAGFSCWMDVGQIGGGDQLYNEIYKGIFHAQVVLAFISPRYTISDYCLKEVSLADLLRKPIIPIMVEKTPWPPPGSLALILSQHIYIDIAGTGGHGGCGRDADWSVKVRELVRRLRLYTNPTQKEESAKPQLSDEVLEIVEAIEAAPVGAGASSASPTETTTDVDNFNVSGPSPQSWGQTNDPGRVPCCVSALSFPAVCTIL